MDEKVYRVIRAYSELSYDQRKEVREKIKEYEDLEYEKRKPLLESLLKSLGPVSQNICPRCGGSGVV
jgi:hypothetical protein